jgi:hypothetical protein
MATQTNTRTARKCVWCGAGSSPENPITTEHIIAEWFTKALEGSGQLNHAYRDHGAEQDTRAWSSNKPSFAVNATCDGCNSGWMSDLETQASRILPPFIRAKPGLRINYKNAPVLARWAAKTGLMFQTIEATENRVIPRSHFPLLRAATIETLPSEMRVWIGAVAALGVWSTSFGGRLNLDTGPVPFYAVLLAVDRVAFMVAGADHGDALAQRRLGPLENGWTQLWPLARPGSWPPPYVWPGEQFPGMPQLMEALIGQAPQRTAWVPRGRRLS